jgi:hypothetical protein
MPKQQDNTGIVITLLIFLSLGLAYSYYTPLWNPPDEERHFAYCEYIAQHHKLPAYQPDAQENIVRTTQSCWKKKSLSMKDRVSSR